MSREEMIFMSILLIGPIWALIGVIVYSMLKEPK
jgi:hypothetical protein